MRFSKGKAKISWEKPGFPEEKLAQAAQGAHLPEPEFIGILHMPGGNRAYSLGNADVDRLTGTEEGRIEGLRFEYWEDDGSQEYARVKKRLQAEGPFVE